MGFIHFSLCLGLCGNKKQHIQKSKSNHFCKKKALLGNTLKIMDPSHSES